MKPVKSVIILVLIIGIFVVLLPNQVGAKQKIGIGGKLVGFVPFLIGSLDLNQFGVEVGGGMSSRSTSYATPFGTYSSNISLACYLANGRYTFPFTRQVQPYVGGGIFGVTGTETVIDDTTGEVLGENSNIGFMGYDLFGGVELPLDSYGLPLTVFGGVNYLVFTTIDDETIASRFYPYPIGVSGTSFHIGAKFEF